MTPHAKPSCHWTLLFQTNSAPRNYGPHLAPLSPQERKLLTPSLQEFQLGESGEGLHLMRHAKNYALLHHDPHYPIALRLFIAEEIRHAKELKSFMDANHIPPVQHTRADSLFRYLRHLAGLELSIAILVAAEILALLYYAALARATTSPHLQNLCRQFLADEITHVHFQSERLAILRRKKHASSLTLNLRSTAYSLFFRAMLLLVWFKHGPIFRAASTPFPTFWKDALMQLDKAKQSMDPRNFRWTDSVAPKNFFVSRLASIRCAFSGLFYMLRRERNTWIHAAATALVIALSIYLRLSPTEWCWIILAIAAVWIAESLNTALELLCDITSPTYNELIRHTKDISAAAVLLTSLTSALIGIFILTPHLSHLI